jgi:hypothetical protein
MAFMDEAVWRGKIYSGGWISGGGGDAAVIEPATGAELEPGCVHRYPVGHHPWRYRPVPVLTC